MEKSNSEIMILTTKDVEARKHRVNSEKYDVVIIIALSVRHWSGRPGFNPKSSHTKDSRMVLDAALLNTQLYKVWIKSKLDKSRERSVALPTPRGSS